MPFRRPRFKLVHWSGLVAVLGLEFGIWPAGDSWFMGALTLYGVLIGAICDRLTFREWMALLSITGLLGLALGLLLPSVQTHCGPGRRPPPATTIGPVSGKI